MDEESRTSRNSRLRNLNEEQFVSLDHSFDERKPWKRKKKKGKEERESRGRRTAIVIHCSMEKIDWVHTCPDDNPFRKSNLPARLSKAGRVCWIAKLSFPPKKAETGCAFALGHRGIANPLLSSRGWPSSLDEFRGPTSRPDEKGHEEAGRRGGKFGNCLSAGYPQTVLRVSRGSGINGDNASQLYDRGRFAIFLGIRTACRNFSTSLFFPSRRNVDDSFIVRVASSREIVVVCKSEDRGKLLFSSGSRRERRDRRNGVEAFYIFISLDITIFYRDKFSKMCDE